MAATAELHPADLAPADVPRRATDVELIGLFEDSGFKEPPYIARRRDGQVVQLAPLLYALAEEVDGRRDTAQIAEALSHRIRRDITPDIAEMLLELARLVGGDGDGLSRAVGEAVEHLAARLHGAE